MDLGLYVLGAVMLLGDSEVLRVFLIFLGGACSFSGGLVYIMCSQRDPRHSSMGYLRFWWNVLSRFAWTKRVFLSNPFAPSPQLPNLIFLANGLVAAGFEVFRALSLYHEHGLRTALLAHGPLLLVLSVITVNNTMLALSLYSTHLANPGRAGLKVELKDYVCGVAATAGLAALIYATIQRIRHGQDAGDFWAWASLGCSIVVRITAVVAFVYTFLRRYRNLLSPELSANTPGFPPSYGFLLFMMGALIALVNTPMERYALIHPVSLFLQSFIMWGYLEGVTRKYESARNRKEGA